MRRKTILMAWLVGAILAVPVAGAFASEEGDESAGTKEKLAIPDSLADLWSGALEKQVQLDQIIAAGKLENVHVTAFQIRDLVKAMPGKSKEMTPDNRKKLESTVTRVAEVAALLDEYGDGGDAVKVKDQAARLSKLLDYVKSLYPAGALGSGLAGPHGGALCSAGPSRWVELVAAKGAISVYVLGDGRKALPIAGMKATAHATVEGKEESVIPLNGAVDHFAATVAIPKGSSVKLHVEVASAGKSIEGHFVVSEKGAIVGAAEEAGAGHGEHPNGEKHEAPAGAKEEHPHKPRN